MGQAVNLTHSLPGTVLTLSYFEAYSRTGLNVRTGYADPDHRAETHEKREFKRGSLKNLRLEVQEGYMATCLAYYCATRYLAPTTAKPALVGSPAGGSVSRAPDLLSLRFELRSLAA